MDKIPSRVIVFLPVILALLLSFFAVKPLFSPGFFSMHDNQQIARLFEMNKALLAGQFPVRWVEGLGFGYGYPLFNFYPPLTYYLGEVYHLGLRTGFIDSTKLVWLTALVGSAVAMYFLAKEFFGKAGGIVSAMFYLYAPYHAVDAYIRGALAELFSFVWLPLILLFSYEAVRERSFKNAVLAGLFLGLLMLTHNLIFLPFMGFFTIWYFVMVLIFGRTSFLKSCILYLVSCILAFGLSAFFWLPALAEKQYTLVDQILIKNLASYKIHFLCSSQLWDSSWGFGGSVPGCVDGVSFKIGKLHIILSILSMFTAGYLWKRNRKLSLVILSSIFFILFSAFMTTNFSSVIWDNVSQLWYLQFPWRFLEFVVLFVSLASGAIVLLAKNVRVQWAVAGLVVFLAIYVNGKYFTPQTYYPDTTDKELTSDREIKWHVSSTSFEFMSADVATKLNEKGVVWVDVDQTRVQSSEFMVQSGDFVLIKEDFAPGKFTLIGTSIGGAVIQVQISDFPGWTVFVDGQPATPDRNNKYRLPTLTVLPGEHEITGRFENTPVRTLGNMISALSIIALGPIFFYGASRNRA